MFRSLVWPLALETFIEVVMKLHPALSAVVASACMTAATLTFADPNNAPAQGPNVRGNMANGAAHGQPNTGDTGGGMAAMAPDPVAQQIMVFAKDPATAGDHLFALTAGCGNMWEVAFSKMVAEKGSDPKVKELANMIATDHMAAEQKLEPIAQKLNVTIPQSLPAEKQAKLDLFASMPPEKIDKIFLSEMKAGHLMNVAMYSDHVKAIKDADLRMYASDTLPKLREHTAAILKANDAAGMTTDLTFQPMQMNQ